MASLLVMGNQRSRAAGLWTLGSVAMGVGTLLLGFRGDWPGWLAFGVMNACFYSGNLLHVAALRMELGMRTAWRLLLIIFVALLAVQEYARVVLESPVLRLSWVLTGIGVLSAWTAWTAWQIQRREGVLSIRFVTIVYAISAAVILGRALLVLLEVFPPEAVSRRWESTATTGAAFLMSVIGNVAILALYLERAGRREMALNAERERRRATQMFAAELAQLDRQRSMSEMAAAMAHELSQPMTAVAVQCGLLRRELSGSEPRLQKVLDNIHQHVDRTLKIIKGISHFMKPGQRQTQRVNLLEVVDQVILLVPASLRSQDVEIQVQRRQAAAWVQGDFVQLSQVVLNLLRNAMEARRPGQVLHVDIDITAEDAHWQVVVEDDGTGLSSALLSSLGAPFVTSKEDGMGIGLYISRRIAQDHGGSLTVANKSQGQGARMVLKLPQVASHG
jgi:signal transduction histidine kinase